MKKLKIDSYVECSAMTDTESVKKVFEKACKLGLSQLGINIQDETDGIPESDQGESVWSNCGFCKIV